MRILLAAALLLATAASAQSPVSAVDPFIGTGPEGHTFPGAAVPFGMVQLSPDTQIRPFKQSYKWAAGYSYEDTTILGFSHTHFSGAGHSDLGDVLLQPISGDVNLEPGDADHPGYRSKFSHNSEKASPGYYAVTLQDYGVKAELTATTRVGVHRYSYPAGKPEHILLDLRSSIYNYPGKVLWSRIRMRNDGTITGMRETRGWAPGRQLYFAIRFSQPVTTHHLYDREAQPILYNGFKSPGNTPEDTQSIEGRGLIAVFDFDTKSDVEKSPAHVPGEPGVITARVSGTSHSTQPLVVKVAISPTSEDEAIANMDAEVPAFDFDKAHTEATAQWEQALGAVDITANADTRKSLYTALYHALLAPSVSMDADGSYRGPDNQVHKANGFHFVSSLSLWDTYRAEQPLMTLLQPAARTADLANSMLASQQQSPFGILPVWQFQGIETWCMIGYHAVPVLADAIAKDIPGFDKNAALKAMVASANYGPYGNLAAYMKLGYVPVDNDQEAASKTVEYAFDDWTIAKTAEKLGRKDIAAEFYKRAQYWRNNFNTKDGFVEPRLANSSYRTPFDPTKAGANSGFTEGNAWQYSWYQPQDELGLIRLLGGPDKLVAKLDEMFDQKVDPAKYADVEDISGMIGQYIHGNEPSHHLPYLYMYAGQPWHTQARLKQIIDSQYKPTPNGLVGNDDLGQMSAWVLFSSLGFYPVAPTSNEYVLGRPFVDRAAMNLPNGKTFTITAQNLSDTNAYVQSVTLNGKPLDRTYITHDEILAGGELHFVMSTKDNAIWSLKTHQAPYSMTK